MCFDIMVFYHYTCFAIVDILKWRKINLNMRKYDPSAFHSFTMNCQWDNCQLDTISKCLTPKLLDSTSINIGFPSGSLMVFSIRVDINIYCSGKSLPNRTDFHISLSVNLATYQTILKNQSWQPNVNITLTSFRKKSKFRRVWVGHLSSWVPKSPSLCHTGCNDQ